MGAHLHEKGGLASHDAPRLLRDYQARHRTPQGEILQNRRQVPRTGFLFYRVGPRLGSPSGLHASSALVNLDAFVRIVAGSRGEVSGRKRDITLNKV